MVYLSSLISCGICQRRNLNYDTNQNVLVFRMPQEHQLFSYQPFIIIKVLK